jgi:glutamyl-tRNA synthetase
MRTRLAPSPTGALHPGNARTFLITWWLARQTGWKLSLRIEDLDGPRIKPAAAAEAIEDLRWLGIDWDDGPVYQSARRAIYAGAIAALLKDGFAYPCVCTRRDIEAAAGAPHADDGSAVYPGSCRGKFESVEAAAAFAGRPPAVRFRVPDRTVRWSDRVAGDRAIDMASLGDFVIAKSDGTPAYQLAVVVDDAAAGVTDVVRGDDLLDSTPRQILLYEALGLAGKIPNYFHVPLVTGIDGRRLAKRHGDSRLSEYRRRGVPASAMIALLAGWCGIDPVPPGATAADLIDRFGLDQLPKGQTVFDPQVLWIRACV